MDEFTVWDGFDRGEDTKIKTLCRGKTIVARFYDPDREANAKLFISAQHMGELVEAAKPIAALAAEIERLAIDIPPEAFARSVPWEHLANLRAILAKIGGGK